MKPSYAAAFFAVTILTVVHGAARNAETAASAVRTLFDQCQTTITGPDGRPQVIYQQCLPGQGPNNPNIAGPRVTGIINPDWLRKNMEEQQRNIYRALSPTGCSSASSQYAYQQCMVGKNLENADRAARLATQQAAMQAARDAARREYRRPLEQTPEQIAAQRAAMEAAQAAQAAANAQWMQNNQQNTTMVFEDCDASARSAFEASCGSAGVAVTYAGCMRRNAMQNSAVVRIVGSRGSCATDFMRCMEQFANQCTAPASMNCLPDPFRCS